MKNIIIILICFLVTSCGTTKKLTVTDTHMSVHTEIEQNDSTSILSNQVDIVNSIVDRIDLSKVIITYYNPPDSTGKQTINRTIEVANNVKTKTAVTKKTDQNKAVKSGSNKKQKDDASLSQHQESKTVKEALPIKIYLISIAAVIVVGFLVYKWIRKKFLRL